MDLRELSNPHCTRHPWEAARLKAVRKILSPHLFEGIRVLDEGCGDGFIARNLLSFLESKRVTAVDSNLSAAEMEAFSTFSPGIEYRNSNPEGEFDLVLLLDVLEHIEDDAGFLTSLVCDSLVEGGKILITVPTFPSLYSRHDSFLGHHRRYAAGQLEAVAKQSGLSVLSAGYLFSTLLAPKLILYKLSTQGDAAKGVGQWSHGKMATAFVESILNLDNSLLLAAGKFGMRIPGLSGWALCQKPP